MRCGNRVSERLNHSVCEEISSELPCKEVKPQGSSPPKKERGPRSRMRKKAGGRKNK